MPKQKLYSFRKLLCETVTNMCFATTLYCALILVMNYFGVQITWNTTMLFSVIASITGVAYVLTIKNPLNFVGFFPGIVMTLFLTLQFFTMKSFDLVVLYSCIFLPIQIKTIIEWRKAWKYTQLNLSEFNKFIPEYLAPKKMLLAFVAFIFITIADLFLLEYVMKSTLSLFAMICSAMMVASSVLANFLLIYKKIDAWIYWVVYSLSSTMFAILINNQFNLILFIFFLIINSYTAVAWIKMRK